VKRWLIAGGVVVALFAALLTVTALLPEPSERQAGSITNPRPAGVRALAQVLAANGVTVTQATILAEATAAADGSTLAIYLNQGLSTDALTRLSHVDADLVVISMASDFTAVETLTEGRITTDYWWSDADEFPADCTDPDALAAGRIATTSSGLGSLSDEVTMCFPGAGGGGLYADTTTDRHRVTVVAGDEWLRNDTITDYGNAALALRVLGRNPILTWYLPGPDAVATTDGDDSGVNLMALFPPWAGPAFWLLLAAGAASALWRGRRFGALVREPLPVEVPASEVSSGLARLYRQAGARGHAAAGLRAGTVHRVAPRLGLTTAASAELVIERIAQASGEPSEQLRDLVYGPPPTTDAALVELATRLADLERKLSAHV